MIAINIPMPVNANCCIFLEEDPDDNTAYCCIHCGICKGLFKEGCSIIDPYIGSDIRCYPHIGGAFDESKEGTMKQILGGIK